VIKEELKNYTRIALVATKLGVSEAHRKHAVENARFFNLRYEEIEGSLKFFKGRSLFDLHYDHFAVVGLYQYIVASEQLGDKLGVLVANMNLNQFRQNLLALPNWSH
jgi:hypothetical protein